MEKSIGHSTKKLYQPFSTGMQQFVFAFCDSLYSWQVLALDFRQRVKPQVLVYYITNRMVQIAQQQRFFSIQKWQHFVYRDLWQPKYSPKTCRLKDCSIVFLSYHSLKFFLQSLQVTFYFCSHKYGSCPFYKQRDLHFLGARQAQFGVFQLHNATRTD